MLSRKISLVIIIGIITGVVIAGFTAVVLIDISKSYPLSLPFTGRWTFSASLDRTVYHPGDNMTLTVQLTCLIDHEIKEYFFSYGHWYGIVENSTNDSVWIPPRPPGIIIPVLKLQKGDEFGATDIYHLGTTEQRPEDSLLDFSRWIPVLPPGDYQFAVCVNSQLARNAGPEESVIRIPFVIV